MFMDSFGALLCWLTFSNVATNAGAAGVARCFFSGAITGVALEEPLQFSEFPFPCTDGGAEYPVGSIVGLKPDASVGISRRIGGYG